MRYDETHPRYAFFECWERMGLDRELRRHTKWVDPDAGTICEFVIEWENPEKIDGVSISGIYKADADGKPIELERRGSFFVRDTETGEINP